MKPLKKIYRAQMKAVPAFADKMIEKPNRMRRMMNLWPPLLCSGIKTVSYTHLTLPTNREV
mgnify:CR=1 FL=1